MTVKIECRVCGSTKEVPYIPPDCYPSDLLNCGHSNASFRHTNAKPVEAEDNKIKTRGGLPICPHCNNSYTWEEYWDHIKKCAKKTGKQRYELQKGMQQVFDQYI